MIKTQKKHEIVIAFDDMLCEIIRNKKLELIVTKLCIRCKKLNILIVSITQYHFVVPKSVRLHSVHYFIDRNVIYCPLQQIVFNYYLT